MRTRFSYTNIAIPCAVILLLLVGCIGEDPRIDGDAPSIKYLRLFFDQLNPRDQRLVFDGLPADLKYTIVTGHWAERLETTNTPNERRLIQSLIDNLQAEYYADEGFAESEVSAFWRAQIDAAAEIYEGDASKVVALLARFGGDPEAEMLITKWTKPDCNCNIKHDMCFFSDCETFDCKKTKGSGCGPAWLYGCDGMCVRKSE